jgi:TatD DNase family protein
MLIDTHAHLYSDDFSDDRDEMIKRASDAGVQKIILPNIDVGSIMPMINLCSAYPGVCYPLMGLHPTSVGEDYLLQLNTVEEWLGTRKFYGIGEIGIDLYWDKTYQKEQEDAFRVQLQWAKSYQYPVVIHVRNSFQEVYSILSEEQDGRLSGVFHCFSGSSDDARKIAEAGFLIGIGGVVTFKNSNLPEVLSEIDPGQLLLETDAPYLAPVPYRGRRNESAYLTFVAGKLAEIYGISANEVGRITSDNATRLFGI